MSGCCSLGLALSNMAIELFQPGAQDSLRLPMYKLSQARHPPSRTWAGCFQGVQYVFGPPIQPSTVPCCVSEA
jgi:hypothetical protein